MICLIVPRKISKESLSTGDTRDGFKENPTRTWNFPFGVSSKMVCSAPSASLTTERPNWQSVRFDTAVDDIDSLRGSDVVLQGSDPGKILDNTGIGATITVFNLARVENIRSQLLIKLSGVLSDALQMVQSGVLRSKLTRERIILNNSNQISHNTDIRMVWRNRRMATRGSQLDVQVGATFLADRR
ncbi:hypothetical protein WICPIJ_007825 [Wickerhamomyces pijperi]|uniref:Uncharacterized protein n=1 Tax=Wickerhamomyces pijperi TaxID=599730 RepID=A0A9P8PZ29_WICPI|nr:hypothetical protein WICPIJ_007825 [Wickerhamomyces pijperi]